MIFGNPAMLWGLLAVLIPVVVHLFNFRRYKKVYFSNVDQLVDLRTESRRHNNLRQWLVLAMRVLAIVFLVLAFAQPVIGHRNGNARSGQTAVSIFVDNSYSMEGASGDGSLLDLACGKAREIAETYSVGDRFHLVTSALEGNEMRWLSRDEFYESLDAVRPSAASPSLSTVVGRQVDFMRQGGAANRHIYVISDCQRSMCDFESLPVDSNVSVMIVPLEGVASDNIYIDTLRLDAPAYFVGGTVGAEVTVRNSGDRDMEKVPLRLYADGRERALATVDIAAGATARIVLRFALDRAGWIDGRVEIDDYPVTFDDSWFFALHVGDRITMAEVRGRMAGDGLHRLFEADSSVDYRYMSRIPASLADIDFVVLNELDALTSGEAQQLAAWVAEGGSLLVVPPAEECPETLAPMLASMQAPVPDRWVKRTVRAKSIDYASSLYREVFASRDEDMELPTVQGHYTFTGASVGQAVITLADGGDMLTVTPFGKGRLYLFAEPLRTEWTDFTAQALFVPTIYNMALYSRPLPPASYMLGATDPIVLQGSYAHDERMPELMSPDSATGIIPDIRWVGSRSLLVPHGDLGVAGIFRLADEHLAFNYMRRESVMDFLDREEVEEAVSGKAGYGVIKNARKPLGDELRARDGGRRLWRLCLLLTLASLAVETALLKIKNKSYAAS